MLQTTVTIGKNFWDTNIEQFLNLKNSSQDSPQKLREKHTFFLDTLNCQYFPTEKLWICLNLQKMWCLDPQPDTGYVEDRQRGSSALESWMCNRRHKHSTRLWLLLQPPRRTPSHWLALQIHWWFQTAMLMERGSTSQLQVHVSLPAPLISLHADTNICSSKTQPHDRLWLMSWVCSLIQFTTWTLYSTTSEGEARRWDCTARTEVNTGLLASVVMLV